MQSSALIGQDWGAARIGITALPAEISSAWLISLYAVRDAFLRLNYP